MTIGGIQMAAAQFAMGALLGRYFGPNGTGHIPPSAAVAVLVIVCLFVSGFAYSWGPLGWLVGIYIPILHAPASADSAARLGKSSQTSHLQDALPCHAFCNLKSLCQEHQQSKPSQTTGGSHIGILCRSRQRSQRWKPVRLAWL